LNKVYLKKGRKANCGVNATEGVTSARLKILRKPTTRSGTARNTTAWRSSAIFAGRTFGEFAARAFESR
jgi:hypothetical protein